MNEGEAKQLLIDAGIPANQITRDAILIASALGDAIAKRAADALVEKMLKHTTFGPRSRPAGAVDYQGVKCECGFLELRFGLVPLTECPKCHRLIEGEWPEVIG
ncbi:MAG TPA: hypothetical protein VIX17_11500 [Pyrinomonadaceae bacterium]|jgi:hypothetical protein